MPGRILIVDDVASNRIVMQVKLESAHYQIVQARTGGEALDIAQRETPDLILLDMMLPDMNGKAVCEALKNNYETAQIPIIVITSASDLTTKMAALEAGAEEFLSKPVDDITLLARVRSLLRARDAADELRLRDGTNRALGFAEEETGFELPPKVALIAPNAKTAQNWKDGLNTKLRGKFDVVDKTNVLDMETAQKAHDVFVISAHLNVRDEGLRLITDLRSRAGTRHSAILIVVPSGDSNLSAMALDLGANDLIAEGFDTAELAVRLKTQIRHKRHSDRLRARVKDGLRAAITDPLTGLYNRRYAMPHLERIAERAHTNGKPFALMLLDLDHFKSVNDAYGHAAGDQVLQSVSQCLQENLRAVDLVARIGGEEFMVAMPDTSLEAARGAAKRLCGVIRSTPVKISGYSDPIYTSASIGVAMADWTLNSSADVETVLRHADRALYAAKADGRNQVTISKGAA
ncbi:diguanylate cyclase [Parasulfitobacter algicola]|uniref:diguanylate cyclase n=1 Tax=Parasulfitobacter algicola TaxID=2614809 RepID=A0ABX2IM12_9RHOB|nr:diguanylate cyclase [Sulfitobacter algicola]NSX53912.1 diguanylate cyclase [Sulfitobacter algicola]